MTRTNARPRLALSVVAATSIIVGSVLFAAPAQACSLGEMCGWTGANRTGSQWHTLSSSKSDFYGTGFNDAFTSLQNFTSHCIQWYKDANYSGYDYAMSANTWTGQLDPVWPGWDNVISSVRYC